MRNNEGLWGPGLRIMQTYALPGKKMISSITRTLTEEEAKFHRFDGCEFRDECLIFAIKGGFKSFSCVMCRHFQEKTKSDAE